jgi:Tfp pilus assembly protein PilO
MRKPIEKQIATLNWVLHGMGVVAAALLLGGFVQFVLFPLRDNSAACEQRISQLDAMLAQSTKVQADHRNLNAELASLKESVAETQRRLPKELHEHEFLDQVREIASSTGIELGEYQLGIVQELASYSKAELSFQCFGSFASICRFLDKIDHLTRITEISRLQIESTDNFNRYPVEVTFVLYFGGGKHDRNMRGDVL